MAFTPEELASIANSALDYYADKGTAWKQSIQAKPMLDVMESNAKTFPGGKGDISLAVQGFHGFPRDAAGTPVPVPAGGDDTLKGYTHDDNVNFYTPANIERANYPWREHHIGLTLTHTELKIDGISVVDTNGARTSNHSRREMTALVNLLDEKLFDLGEQYARGMNNFLWGDGTSDPLAIAGLQSIVTQDPTSGTVGGIDRSVADWWRNRARTTAHAGSGGTGPVTSDPADGGALLQVLQYEMRQLRRYGGRPNTFLVGSDFLDAMEVEIRANGNYSQTGFRGGQDGAMGDMRFMSIPVRYDPTLDDVGQSKYGYLWDNRDIYLYKMENEWRKNHSPARPPDQFVLFRSITSTGQMVARRCNSALVVELT